MTWTKEDHKVYMREYRKKYGAKLRAQARTARKAKLEEYRKKDREYFQKNKQKLYAYARKWTKDRYRTDPAYREAKKAKARLEYSEIREKLFQVLGGKCTKCDYLGPAWHLDHPNSDGYLERAKWSQIKIYRYAIKHPEQYQILCPNHNFEKRLELKEFPKRKVLIG